MKEITIEKNDSNQRLDRFLKKYLAKAPLSVIYRVIRKDVKIAGKRPKEDYQLMEGDVLQLYLSDQDIESFTEKKPRRRAKRQFTICYEDDNVIAVNKPFGLLVHGDKTEKKDTLANQVVDYLIETGSYIPRLEKSFTPSPAHRLDRNTTGLVVFGKNSEALRTLAAMFKDDDGQDPESPKEESEAIRPITKTYLCVVCGELKKEYHLKNRLVKDERRNKGIVKPLNYSEGKYIETRVFPVYTDGRYSLAKVELITGRSHQIRAHLASIGFPLAGDTKYGGKALKLQTADTPQGQENISTQLLHAWKMDFLAAPEPLAYLNGTDIKAPASAYFSEGCSALLGISPEELGF